MILTRYISVFYFNDANCGNMQENINIKTGVDLFTTPTPSKSSCCISACQFKEKPALNYIQTKHFYGWLRYIIHASAHYNRTIYVGFLGLT